MNADEQKNLLDKLQNRLEKQIELASQGNYKQVELIAEQNGEIITKIAEQRTFADENLKTQREHILSLYKKLELMIAAEKSIILNQQQQTDNVRKTLNIYRSNN